MSGGIGDRATLGHAWSGGSDVCQIWADINGYSRAVKLVWFIEHVLAGVLHACFGFVWRYTTAADMV